MAELNPEEIYKQALKKWGFTSQVLMCAEECTELAQACFKTVRVTQCKKFINIPDNFYEELADVEIMIEQMREITGDRGSLTIDVIKKRKLSRLLDRLRDAEGKS